MYIQLEEAGIIEIFSITGFTLKKDFDTQMYKLMATKSLDNKMIEVQSFGINKEAALKKLKYLFDDIKNAGTVGRTSLIWDFKK